MTDRSATSNDGTVVTVAIEATGGTAAVSAATTTAVGTTAAAMTVVAIAVVVMHAVTIVAMTTAVAATTVGAMTVVASVVTIVVVIVGGVLRSVVMTGRLGLAGTTVIAGSGVTVTGLPSVVTTAGTVASA
ncbi:hypothetical protein AB0D34_09660 [Streptomyces sp. NPDC048420]|uniref:hypothetical protein n=1 Tax=Streptomyces sp. NPDC048420 TaxID=3155755 RepID=UPI003436F464